MSHILFDLAQKRCLGPYENHGLHMSKYPWSSMQRAMLCKLFSWNNNSQYNNVPRFTVGYVDRNA